MDPVEADFFTTRICSHSMLANCENVIQEHDFLASTPGSEMAPSFIQIHAFRKEIAVSGVDMCQADCFLFWKSLCSVRAAMVLFILCKGSWPAQWEPFSNVSVELRPRL